ncbi:programmed cell death protein 5-like [Saccoglossus kowalevskii]|uniref:Programmed cell death protein 5-like n=1 Tax=Saccoglossus kowalevskii TaxID=10224 RepID=A0ABM0GLL6_SACKO|nr:PREDICTED: programmed cell death protein 5-like [Saccoglossus kowalevskii]
MDDAELEKIREKRMAELQQQLGGQGGPSSQKDQEERKARQEEMKHSILAQVLDQSARARLSSIAMVKPEKASMVENMLISMAQRGQIQSKLSEQELKGLLESVSQQTQKKTTVKFDRRRVMDSDDEDDY